MYDIRTFSNFDKSKDALLKSSYRRSTAEEREREGSWLQNQMTGKFELTRD
jgi:hypothetical protein